MAELDDLYEKCLGCGDPLPLTAECAAVRLCAVCRTSTIEEIAARSVKPPEFTLRSDNIQIDMKDMDPGSFPSEFREHIGKTRFRATLDVIILRFGSLGAIHPRESVRLVCSGRVTLRKDDENGT